MDTGAKPLLLMVPNPSKGTVLPMSSPTVHWNDRGEVARRLATRTDTLDTHAASSRVFYPIFIEIVIILDRW